MYCYNIRESCEQQSFAYLLLHNREAVENYPDKSGSRFISLNWVISRKMRVTSKLSRARSGVTKPVPRAKLGPLSAAQIRNTDVYERAWEIYTRLRGDQCHIEIRLFAITRFRVFARIIPCLAVIGSNRATREFSSQIVRSREKRAFPVTQSPADNAKDSVYFRQPREIRRERGKDRARSISIRQTDRRNHDVNRKLWRIFAAQAYVCVSRALRENLRNIRHARFDLYRRR